MGGSCKRKYPQLSEDTKLYLHNEQVKYAPRNLMRDNGKKVKEIMLVKISEMINIHTVGYVLQENVKI